MTGEAFYSRTLKRVIHPSEEIYLEELKVHIEEKISFYRNSGCGTAGCLSTELLLRNELNSINNILSSTGGKG